MDNNTTQLIYMQGPMTRLLEIPADSIDYVVAAIPHEVDRHDFNLAMNFILRENGGIFYVDSIKHVGFISKYMRSLKGNPLTFLFVNFAYPLFSLHLGFNTVCFVTEPLGVPKSLLQVSKAKLPDNLEVYHI